MGYKLAGYDVIGNVEIDKNMMQIYRKNNNPKYSYLMDIRDFVELPNDELPQELFNLDILDGSPPCTTFSTAGLREKSWGKEKQFREGLKKQRLDDLFFVFIETIKKLRPKIFVAENVEGLIKGNAKGYVNEIIRELKQANYTVQIFLLDASFMGVPQKRKRVFFVGHDTKYDWSPLSLSYHEEPILFGNIRTENGRPWAHAESNYKKLLSQRRKSDKSIADISERLYGKTSGFNHAIIHDDAVANTIVSSCRAYRYCDGLIMSAYDIIHCQTFPEDYDFMGQDVRYVCGMSVPPVMMAHIANDIYNQWLSNKEG